VHASTTVSSCSVRAIARSITWLDGCGHRCERSRPLRGILTDGDPEQMRRLSETDTFLVEQFASFLDQLEACEEEGRPLLDSTQVLLGSGMCYGQSHGNANLPTILAGGRALGYRHGRHVDFNLPKIGSYDVADADALYRVCSRPVDERARLSNLLLTMCQRAGVENDAFQDSLGTASQVLG